MDISSENYSTSFKNRMHILETLEEVLAEKTFDKVSVKEICARSCVSRSMFYTCFENKSDVIRWYVRMAMDEGVNKIGIRYNWFEGHLATTRAFADYRHACYGVLLNKASADEQRGFFHDLRYGALCEALAAHGISLSTKLEFQVESLIAAELVGTSRFFDRTSVKELTGYLVSIVPRDLYDALDRPLNPDRHQGAFQNAHVGHSGPARPKR